MINTKIDGKLLMMLSVEGKQLSINQSTRLQGAASNAEYD